jgi:hypothetical protein
MSDEQDKSKKRKVQWSDQQPKVAAVESTSNSTAPANESAKNPQLRRVRFLLLTRQALL